jgi:hypothetical protein
MKLDNLGIMRTSGLAKEVLAVHFKLRSDTIRRTIAYERLAILVRINVSRFKTHPRSQAVLRVIMLPFLTPAPSAVGCLNLPVYFPRTPRGAFLIINPLKPNDPYMGRTAPLTSKRFILCIYSTNIDTEYFKHGIYSPFFPLEKGVFFIILMYLVPVLFTFYIQGVLKLKK